MNIFLTILSMVIIVTISLLTLSYKKPEIYNDIQGKVENKLFGLGMVLYFYIYSIIIFHEIGYITINIVSPETLAHLLEPWLVLSSLLSPYLLSIFYLGQIRKVQKYIPHQ